MHARLIKLAENKSITNQFNEQTKKKNNNKQAIKCLRNAVVLNYYEMKKSKNAILSITNSTPFED